MSEIYLKERFRSHSIKWIKEHLEDLKDIIFTKRIPCYKHFNCNFSTDPQTSLARDDCDHCWVNDNLYRLYDYFDMLFFETWY